jgi:hypothetical protein
VCPALLYQVLGERQRIAPQQHLAPSAKFRDCRFKEFKSRRNGPGQDLAEREDTMDYRAKADEINLVLSEPNVNLWKLRELALTEGDS